MENIKSFEQFINENYTNEGLINTIKTGVKKASKLITGKVETIEEWWDRNRYSPTPGYDGCLSNFKYVEYLFNRGIADELNEDDKRRIEEEAKLDNFQGEIGWNRNKEEWYYSPGNNIKLGSYMHGGK